MEGDAVFTLDPQAQRLLAREHAERLRQDARRPTPKTVVERLEAERIRLHPAPRRAAV